MKITDVAAAKIHLLCLNSAFDRESIGVKKWLVDMDLGKVFPKYWEDNIYWRIFIQAAWNPDKKAGKGFSYILLKAKGSVFT